MTTEASPINFSDNFWESLDKNGITILLERMRGAKQTCEKFKHAYESRALLEEEYGKTLLQIAQKQKISSTENGSSQHAMDTMQQQFQTVAESHLQLSSSLREKVVVPVSRLLNKQRILKKELQTSIQKLYNNRQVQANFVHRAHKRHNLEIEKANLLVQQQGSEKDKIATFKSASVTIDKLKKVYDEALQDLSTMVLEWNKEWVHTCQAFERLELERLEFFKSNLSDCVNLLITCHQGEIEACETINTEASKIDVVQDLIEFVNTNKSTSVIPTAKNYIKLHAYHEANQSTKFTQNDIDHEDQSESEDRAHVNRKMSVSSSPVQSEPVMMVGVMETVNEPVIMVKEKPKAESQPERLASQDEKVDRLMSAYQEMNRENAQTPPSLLASKNNSFNNRRRVSFVETIPQETPESIVTKPVEPPHTLDRFNSFGMNYNREEDFASSADEAAFELDDMLRELDSKRIIRDGPEESVRYRTHNIKPTASISSPSLLQKQQQRRSNIPSAQYFPNPQSRRMSTIESPSYSRQSSISSQGYTDVYDPFNSLSSKETASPLNSNSSRRSSVGVGSIRSAGITNSSPPTAQSIHDRMLKQNNESIATSSPVGSVEQPASYRSSKFIQEYQRNQAPSPDVVVPDRVAGFIDFAYALYDYEEQDEGEIAFKEGDLLGVISKSDEDDEQGWWEASLLNPRNRRVIKSGLVPSNFLETVSK
ncbi:hypothetical protein INT48_006365 [Thamnidium elegans]|uniref:Uncharacterized protein n=1 Tax=Thamnidium elegans TaxID=101142 RepID=A0A8H7SK93_9FUNG|nr:hypothetical protein INT48_006365 [Thamnidium elegans]